MTVRPVCHDIVPLWSPADGPDDPRHFSVDLWIYIGHDGGSGSDRFDAVACTRSWLATGDPRPHPSAPISIDRDRPNGGYFVRGLILLPEWDPAALRRIIDELCDSCAGPTWLTAANRLSRYLSWEYADRYDDAANPAHLT